MTAVAIAAATLAAVMVLLITSGTAAAPPAAATAGPPPAGAPIQGGGFPGGGGSGGTLLMGGRVTSVSATSITLTAQGHTLTAAITGATRFSGVRGVGGIKVGDQVMATIGGYGTGHLIASSIQDPAQFP